MRKKVQSMLVVASLWTVFVGILVADDPAITELPGATPPVANLYDGAEAVEPLQIMASPLMKSNPDGLFDVSLQDVIPRIEEVAQLQVRVDWGSLEEAGSSLKPDTIIHQWPAGKTVRQLLREIPDEHAVGFAWIIEGRCLTLTTQEKASEMFSIRRYYIGDLVQSDFPANKVVDILIQLTTGPWDVDEPGTGTISILGNHLFIRQTQYVQQEILGVLSALRIPAPIVLVGDTSDDLRLRKLMEERVVDFDITEVSLPDFAQHLTELVGADVRIDNQALTDMGLDRETIISARAKQLPLGKALEMNLSNVNGCELTVIIEDGAYVLTSFEKAREKYEVSVYNVGGLGITRDRLHQFVAMIESETLGPWDADEPGTGKIGVYPNRNSLIVRQTSRVQREILELLKELRTLSDTEPLFASPQAADHRVRTKYYSMAPETAAALMKVIPETIAAGSWEVGISENTTSGDHDQAQKTEGASPPNAKSNVKCRGRISSVSVPVRYENLVTLELSTPSVERVQLEQLRTTQQKNESSKIQETCFLVVTHEPEVHAAILQLIKGLHGITDTAEKSNLGGGFFTIEQHD